MVVPAESKSYGDETSVSIGASNHVALAEFDDSLWKLSNPNETIQPVDLELVQLPHELHQSSISAEPW